jgi:ribosome-binding factor A
MSQRTDRVDELLRQEIGTILARDLADPRIGFATITDVETSPDLRHAKVWVSVIGGRTDRVETLRALQASMGFVRHELGKRLRIKRIPALHIHLDDTAERGTRVLHLLGELESGVDPQEISPFNESLPTPVKRLPHEGDAPEPEPAAATDPGALSADGEPGSGVVAGAGASTVPAGKPRSGRRPNGRGHGVDRSPGIRTRSTGKNPGKQAGKQPGSRRG